MNETFRLIFEFPMFRWGYARGMWHGWLIGMLSGAFIVWFSLLIRPLP